MTPTITHEDRRRLGSMLQEAQSLGLERPEYLDALEIDLERARWADQSTIPSDLVTMNSTVEVLDLNSGEVETYTLVYPEDADAAAGRISVFAPMTRALLGSRAGGVVKVQAPEGWRRIRVKSVLYQPERAGDYHL